MKTDLTMDDDQLARFIDLLSDRYKEDTWQSLADMVINAGLHSLETMDDEKDNRPEEDTERGKLVYACGECQYVSCIMTVTGDITPYRPRSIWADCPLCAGKGHPFKLVKEE